MHIFIVALSVIFSSSMQASSKAAHNTYIEYHEDKQRIIYTHPTITAIFDKETQEHQAFLIQDGPSTPQHLAKPDEIFMKLKKLQAQQEYESKAHVHAIRNNIARHDNKRIISYTSHNLQAYYSKTNKKYWAYVLGNGSKICMPNDQAKNTFKDLKTRFFATSRPKDRIQKFKTL